MEAGKETTTTVLARPRRREGKVCSPPPPPPLPTYNDVEVTFGRLRGGEKEGGVVEARLFFSFLSPSPSIVCQPGPKRDYSESSSIIAAIATQ